MKTKTKSLLSPYEARQNRKRIFLLLAFILLATVMFPVFCDWDIAEWLTGKNVMSSMGKRALEMLDNLLIPDEDVVNMLKVNISGTTYQIGSYTIAIGAIVNTANTICRNVAVMLVVTMFCISLAQGFIDGTAYDEIVMKKLIVFGMSIACIFAAQDVCTELANLGTEVVTALYTENGGSTDDSLSTEPKTATVTIGSHQGDVYDSDRSNAEPVQYTTVKTEGENAIADYQQEIVNRSSYYVGNIPVFSDVAGIAKKIGAEVEGSGYVITLAIPYFCSWLCSVLVMGICWVRAVELILLIAFSPLAFVSINGHSPIESLLRFLKQFFAVVIQGAIILMTVYIMNLIRTDVFAEGFAKHSGQATSALINIVVLTMVQAGIVGRSRSIAQSIVGN